MPRLTSLRRRRGDRGAVAALVSVLLAGNVLLGMSALVLDVGLLYAEREQLQSGADAAAIAVAKLCAASNKACDDTAASKLARRYADGNARDGKSAALICGRVLTGGSAPVNRLAECDAGASNLTGCVGPPPLEPQSYVEVRTSTLIDGGGTVLPPVFAGALTGTGGTTVGACSRVTWGAVEKATSEAALAISICDYRAATVQGTEFQPPPIGRNDNPAAEPDRGIVLRWRRPSSRGCNFGGATFPAGFGFFTGSCQRTLTVDAWVRAETRPGISQSCGKRVHDAHHRLTPVTVAIFDNVRPRGQNGYELHVVGLAVFVISGWRLPDDEDDWPRPPVIDHDHPPGRIPDPGKPNLLCRSNTNTMCLYGYFTTRLMQITSSTRLGRLDRPHYGSIYVRTIG